MFDLLLVLIMVLVEIPLAPPPTSPDRDLLTYDEKVAPFRATLMFYRKCVWECGGMFDLQNEMSVTALYGLRNGQCYPFHRHRRGLPLSLESLL